MIQGAYEARIVAMLSIVTGMSTIYLDAIDGRNLECICYGYSFNHLTNREELQCRHLVQSSEAMYILIVMNCLTVFTSILVLIPTREAALTNTKTRHFLIPYILWHIIWFIVTTKDLVIIDQIHKVVMHNSGTTSSFDAIKALVLLTSTVVVGLYHKTLIERYANMDENCNEIFMEDV